MKLEVKMEVLFGRKQGEKTLGRILKVNRTTCQIEQMEARGTMRDYKIGTKWKVPHSLIFPKDGSTTVAVVAPSAPKTKRAEAVILQEIQDYYNALSPENLHCDGEISRAAAARRGAEYHRQLKVLFKELGRKVDEDEAFGLPKSNWKFAVVKIPSKFTAGVKVFFFAKGKTIVGVIETVNKKTVTVKTETGSWRVSPSLLSVVL